MATLRQIFTKMANDVKKYPNIVQLTKTLDEGFKEVAENISGGGGGGSTVSVTQTQTSGNKIGTVTVDGVGTDLYAPKATLSLSGTGNRTLSLNTQVTGSVDVSAVDLPVGDTVSVNPIQTTGTTIAEITVNNVTAQIKAPSAVAPTHNYSTTEQVVGKWIDGTTDVYEKVINISNFSASNYNGNVAFGGYNYSDDLPTLAHICLVAGWYYISGDNVYRSFLFSNEEATDNVITLYTNYTRSNVSGTIIVRYIKA